VTTLSDPAPADPGCDRDGQLVVVAKRLPVRRVSAGAAEPEWLPSPGGLISALAPALSGRRCVWVGWTGDVGGAAPFTRGEVQFEPVELSACEVEEFYEGFSNRTLWPIYHDAIRPVEFEPSWWSTYVAVNERFAAHAAKVAQPGASVWVHDYQLQLVPGLLRRMRPDLRIGFFLHISFPPQELFMQLPSRRRIVEGILGADVVGFQVPVAARNFAVLARRLTEAQGRGSELAYQGRTVRIGAFPVSIDVDHIEEIAGRFDTQLRAKEIREQLGNPARLLLGVDRLDYTKGIEPRLLAYKEMLTDGLISVPECVMVQIAVPTRDNVPAYIDERVNIERLVGELNGDFGHMGAPAVHYLHQSLELDELVALYCAADVLVVTPFRDGMNLVCKEYIASRIDDTGSVVLSEFAGAARQMGPAHLVNPHDREALQRAILAAVNSSPIEQARRMRSLRRSLRSWTGAHWANAFLGDLTANDCTTRSSHRPAGSATQGG
jgi:trehalose 6-phosphate synthase